MLPNEIRDLLRKPPAVVNGTRRHFLCRHDTMCEQDAVIIVTEGGGLVDDARAIGIGDVGVYENPKTLGRVLCNEW